MAITILSLNYTVLLYTYIKVEPSHSLKVCNYIMDQTCIFTKIITKKDFVIVITDTEKHWLKGDIEYIDEILADSPFISNVKHRVKHVPYG